MDDNRTNKDFVKDLMDKSILHETFIIEAISYYSNKVSELTEEELEEAGHSLINMNDWQSIAKETKKELTKKYGE